MSTQALKRGQTIQELTGYTDSIRFTVADLTEAGTTQTLNLDIKAGQQVRSVAYKLHTAFSGGSASSVTIDVGDGTDPDGYIDAESIFTGGNAYGPSAADAELGIKGKVYAVNDQINFLFTSDVNVNALTAGDIEIFFNLVHVDEFAGRQVS